MARLAYSPNVSSTTSDADQRAWVGAGLWLAPLAALLVVLVNGAALAQALPAVVTAFNASLEGVATGAAPAAFLPSLGLEVSFGLLTGVLVARLRSRTRTALWIESLVENLFTRELFSPGPWFLPLLLTNTLVGVSVGGVMATLVPVTDLGAGSPFGVLAAGGGGEAVGGAPLFCAIVLLCVLLAALIGLTIHGLIAWPAILIGAARGGTHGAVVRAYCGLEADSTGKRLFASLTHGAAAGAFQGAIVGVVLAATTALLTTPELTPGGVIGVILPSLWLLSFALIAHENPKAIKEGAELLGCCLLYLIVGGFVVAVISSISN